MSIFVVGNLTWDNLILVQTLPLINQDRLVLKQVRFPGGAAGNVAVALAAYKQTVNLVASVGKDAKGKQLIKDIAGYGIGTSFLEYTGHKTGEFLVIMDEIGNRNFYLDPSQAPFQLQANQLNWMGNPETDSICFVGCSLLLSQKIVSNIKTEVRPFLFANIGFWLAGADLQDSDVGFLNKFDVLFLNKGEYLMLSEFMRKFLLEEFTSNSNRKQLVITAGAQEAQIVSGNREYYIPPRNSDNLVNTLGCGDGFMGAYLASYLSGKSEIASANLGHEWSSYIATLEGERPSPAQMKSFTGRSDLSS